jgi:hypothetical protein
MRTALIAMAISLTAAPLFSQALQAQAPSNLGSARPTPASPYRNLFQPRDPAPASPSQPAKKRVVCGMTIVQADPGLDSKMVSPPKNDQVKYTIRAVPPTTCSLSR